MGMVWNILVLFQVLEFLQEDIQAQFQGLELDIQA
jgi:hypothetical protein